MTPSKIYTFTVPAGGSYQLQAIGSFFKVLAATDLVEVRGDSFGTVGVLLPGQGQRNAPYQRLEFRDLSGNPNRVSVLVAGTDFVDDRIAGTVDVADGGKSRSIAGTAFIVTFGIAAVAGRYGRGQLWNGTTDKRLVVKTYKGSALAATQIKLMQVTAQSAAAVVDVRSKNTGLATLSAASFRVDTVAALNGATPIDYLFVGASDSRQGVFQEPYVVMPGTGLDLECGLANTQANFGFEWVEESIL